MAWCLLRELLFKVDLIVLASLYHTCFHKEASDTKSPNKQRYKQYCNAGKNCCAELVAS